MTRVVLAGLGALLLGSQWNLALADDPIDLTVSNAGAATISGKNTNNANDSDGMRGIATGTGRNTGVLGRTEATADTNSCGVKGEAKPTNKRVYGVWGKTPSTQVGSAGVFGEGGDDLTITQEGWLRPVGVRGNGREMGVSGHSNKTGVQGVIYDATTGRYVASGSLGAAFVNKYGVYTDEDLAAKGVKKFIEPHPIDPSKIIAYVALEGPEAGTYFRGTAATDGGIAVIPVPDHFRFVTAEGSMTVQITPRDLAQVGVVDRNLNQITVRANPDVAFDYLVQGVRRAYADYDPIQPNGGEFGPGAPSGGMPDSMLPEEIRKRLIANGTYNSDGSPNLETAARLGWLDRADPPPSTERNEEHLKDAPR